MTKATAVTILLALLFPHASLSEPASDAQMAKEAVMPYAPRDPDKRRQFLEMHETKLRVAATRAPDAIRPAHVFFNTGLSYRELHELREDFGLEVIDVRMKAPQGDQGVIMSIGGGMADLFAIKGTFEERLAFVVQAQQRCFAKRARIIQDDASPAMAELATKPFFVYSARIFGPNRVLGELQLQPTVSGVILNLPHSIISDFEAAKSYNGPHPYTMPGFYC